MRELLEEEVCRVATLPREEQDASASQITETLQDEATWREKPARAFSATGEEIVCRSTTPAGRLPFRIRECSP